MENTEDNKLDNPVWYSLSESHHSFAVVYDNIKFYHPDYCPFGGFESGQHIMSRAENYSALSDNFFIVGQKPILPDALSIKKDLVCCQMVIYDAIKIDATETIIQLTDQHRGALYDLVNLVQPGYFRKNTFLLGHYSGIFKDHQLVAVTGERMKMEHCIEVSAIVTHPDYGGRGYAKQLVAHMVNKILQQQKIPYLHVVETNIGAIALYEKLGFKLRRKISFWNVSSA